MRISDWSSDVCSSDLGSGDARAIVRREKGDAEGRSAWLSPETCRALKAWLKRADITSGPIFRRVHMDGRIGDPLLGQAIARRFKRLAEAAGIDSTRVRAHRSEEHTSELQSLMRISYA